MDQNSEALSIVKYTDRSDRDSISSDLNYIDDEDDPFINSLWNIHQTLTALRGKNSCHIKEVNYWLKLLKCNSQNIPYIVSRTFFCISYGLVIYFFFT